MANKRQVLERFNTISPFPSLQFIEKYKEPEQADMPYIVDTSSFVPMSEAVKKVTGRASTAGDIAHRYDYPNGRGSPSDKIPVDRTHRFTGDIAEASVAYREAAEEASKSLGEAYERFEAEQRTAKVNEAINSLNNQSE